SSRLLSDILSETLQKYPGLVIDWRVTITMCGRKEWISCLKPLSLPAKKGIRDEKEKIDVSAHAVITLLREAADILKENVDRAIDRFHGSEPTRAAGDALRS